MPCLEISMPAVTVEVRRGLVQRLADVFDEATSFGRGILAIRFHEYQPDLTAIGGNLCEKDAKSPYLHFLLYCPHVDRATRQQLVAGCRYLRWQARLDAGHSHLRAPIRQRGGRWGPIVRCLHSLCGESILL